MFICACSDVGKVRDINQDATHYIEDEVLPIYMVADGMGGHKSGEYASNLAIHTASNFYEDIKDDIKDGSIEIVEFINKAFERANSRILEESLSEDIKKMGTTFTLGMIYEKELYIGHIGDSRAYMLRNGELSQLTHDHSLVAELLKAGSITEEEARNHPQKNVITKAMGTDKNISADIYTLELAKDDIILICSDGLTNMIEDAEIKDILMNSNQEDLLCELLTNKANGRGGLDNISVLIIRI